MAPRGTYRQIADELRQLIACGDLPGGAMVPSEAALAEQHAVSRGTARLALALLADEGLVEVVPGQGRRVVGSTDDRAPATAWERIAAVLRRRLTAGEFPPTASLPSEAALMAEYGLT